jgi:DDE family transposase
LDRRLQKRYLLLVQAHLKSVNALAAGPAIVAGDSSAQSAAQACWRFLKNDRVTLPALAQPLRDHARKEAGRSASKFVLVAHDWSKLDFGTHASKPDVFALTHQHDVGYDLTTSLLVDAATGAPLAPVQMHLKTATAIHSTAATAPGMDDHHLEQLLPTMNEIASWNLPRTPVHIVDREADSLGHFRQWSPAGYLFLIRADDRRVLWEGVPALISEIVAKLAHQGRFQHSRAVTHRGRPASQQVAETTITLHKPHKTRRGGKQYEVSGAPLELRLVISRITNEKGSLLAEWTLVTNVPTGEVPAAEIALWYYWRWRIESFFKLLKGHGLEVEQWQQESGLAIARRLLVAAMACTVVWALQQDSAPAAREFRKVLVKLSGRKMKYQVEHTAPSLLAGYFVYLQMIDFLRTSSYNLAELQSLAQQAGSPFDDSA